MAPFFLNHGVYIAVRELIGHSMHLAFLAAEDNTHGTAVGNYVTRFMQRYKLSFNINISITFSSLSVETLCAALCRFFVDVVTGIVTARRSRHGQRL